MDERALTRANLPWFIGHERGLAAALRGVERPRKQHRCPGRGFVWRRLNGFAERLQRWAVIHQDTIHLHRAREAERCYNRERRGRALCLLFTSIGTAD